MGETFNVLRRRQPRKITNGNTFTLLFTVGACPLNKSLKHAPPRSRRPSSAVMPGIRVSKGYQ